MDRIKHTTFSSICKRQAVCSLQKIKQPPTRGNVVHETLKRSQAVRKECDEGYSFLTWKRERYFERDTSKRMREKAAQIWMT